MLLAQVDKLQCPVCHYGQLTTSTASLSNLELHSGELSCAACGQRFPIRDGIPILLKPDLAYFYNPDYSAKTEGGTEKTRELQWHDARAQDHDELIQMSQQNAYARLRWWQLFELLPFLQELRPMSVLSACCGLGFELSLLAEVCKDLACFDISAYSARAAKQRAESTLAEIRLDAFCADVENIPLKDDSFDLVVAHHSLHHLEDPRLAISELIRVARRYIALFEPSRGIGRKLVKSLKLRSAIEKDGAVIYEFSPTLFQDLGNVKVQRYEKVLVSTVRHKELPLWKWISRLGLTEPFVWLVRTLNLALGSTLGTKATILLEKI
ncbi:MAG: methyltransferase domain-containing protein [Chloroflexi bacterium]|nr:methyltransferase domain-containing protein [Chloroflexota bacterium]MCL5075271.1 methyltransferase domain-containing protein [Chloroflexota bacterium]